MRKPRCIVDSHTCSVFVNQFQHHAKKHRKLESDLHSAINKLLLIIRTRALRQECQNVERLIDLEVLCGVN